MPAADGSTEATSSAGFWAGRMIGPPPLPEVPAGCFTAPPDFVGVGAQKSGTSFWHRHLCRHPAVRAASSKELHFFDRLMTTADPELGEYERHFPRREGELCGEWTPRYMVDPWTPPLLAAVAPRARLLVMLRDPVERFLAGIDWERHRSVNLGGRPASAAAPGDALQRGLYATQLRHLLNWFEPDQLLVLQFERCVADIDRWLRRTYEHIGADPDAAPEPQPVAHNENPLREPGAPHLRRALVEYYTADVVALAERFDAIDPSWWPNFRHLVS